jgi:hypothetical protein
MKSIKLLLALTFVAPAFAIDLKQSNVFTNESMQKAHQAFADVIENCHKNDGKHALRMDVLKDSTYNLSAIDNKRVLDLHAESAQWKALQYYQCNDCKDIDLFVYAGVYFFSKEIEAGRGNISLKDLRDGYMKRTENQ